MPPMWQMVSEAYDAIRGAAALDMGVVMWRPTSPNSRSDWQSTRRRTTQPSAPTFRLAPDRDFRDSFVADSEAEARRIAGEACLGSLNFANWRGPRIYLNPGETLPVDQEAALTKKITYEFAAPVRSSLAHQIR